MTNISFTSTYRIPITQAGINPAKKEKLRQAVEPYPNKQVSKSNTGTVRVSIRNKDDENFIRNLKRIGYKVFQKFEGENIPKNNLDNYIKKKLQLGEYQQFGTQKKRLSTSAKKKRYAAIAEETRIKAEKRASEQETWELRQNKFNRLILEAIAEKEKIAELLAKATEKAEKAQEEKVFAEILEETRKTRIMNEPASKRDKILKKAAKYTEETAKRAELAEQEKADLVRQYEEALDKIEEAKLIAEIPKIKKRQLKSQKSRTFDNYNTNFNFDEYEIK